MKDILKVQADAQIFEIVNKLRIYIGGHAWGIFSALGAANAVVSDLRKLPDDRLGDFVESAVDRLKDCGLETIPDNVPTINVPAVLSWLQREVDFHRTCNHLCLGEFVHEDPQITRELDQLALEQEALNSEASDYDSARSDIERRASMVITPPLSRLRALHFSSIQSDQCECSQHKAPDASGSGTSNQSIQSPTQARDRSDSGSERCSATHLGTPTTHFIPENGQRTFSEPPTAQPTPPDAAGRHGSPREGGFSNSTRTSSETIPPISQKHGVMRPQETALQDPRSPVELGDEVNPARNGGSIHEPQEDTSRTPLQRSHTTPIQQQVPLHQSSQPTGPSYSETTTLRGSQASVLVNADSLPDPRLVNAKSQAADLPQLDNQSHTQHLGSLEQPQDHTSTARPDHRADTEWSSPNLDPPFSHGVSESIEHTQADPEEYLRLVSMQSMTELRTCDELLEMSFTMDLTPSEELIDMDSVLM
ncbi:hypothetical protein BHE90_010082 [Fusarium euwallaceae]|uniref:Uncharacterized protein n=1 Tax=Fusarium euwallaceae TaxID=1147111 RepID=A0A430LIF6_9HYPO|nr:hypothetical protein BHE90_010082 [Fusarium euwallaceae]